MNRPALLSFFCGFVSLSLEIIWVRLYGFTMMSTPAAFGFVLMAYLAGVALGAHWGGKACRQVTDNSQLWQRVVAALLLSCVLTVLIPFLFALGSREWWRSPVIDFFWIASVSSILAYVFPIAHHLGAGEAADQQGKRFACVYTSNVLGAALGPLVTGYILLNVFSLQQTFVLFALLQLAAVGFFYWMQKSWSLRIPMFAAVLAIAVSLGLFAKQYDPHALIQLVNMNGQQAKRVIENKHGIITIFAPDNLDKHAPNDDEVYGGNVYDGRTNLSLIKNTNGLERPLLLAALQPEPKRVLMVGLSIGSWLALVNGFPGVEHIDVVEINAGYLQAAQFYPLQARALKDPRVNVVVDDARRWLRQNSHEKYDLIIMNTTFHWRANASFLLSQEYLQLIKKHMNSGAVMAFNATGSADAFYTATQVFEHAYRYSNFIFAADFDFRARKDSMQAKYIYAQVNLEGMPVFALNDPLIDKYLSKKFVDVELAEKLEGRPLELITDRNAITEYKYGYSLKRMY